MKKRIITMAVVMGLLVGSMSMNSMAVRYSKDYNVVGRLQMGSVTNTSGVSKTLTVGASVTTGDGGAWAEVLNTSGSVVTSKLYMYQNPGATDLSTTVTNGVTRNIAIRPNSSGQRIKGNIHWTWYK